MMDTKKKRKYQLNLHNLLFSQASYRLHSENKKCPWGKKGGFARDLS
jgi:hypothetical protein